MFSFTIFGRLAFDLRGLRILRFPTATSIMRLASRTSSAWLRRQSFGRLERSRASDGVMRMRRGRAEAVPFSQASPSRPSTAESKSCLK